MNINIHNKIISFDQSKAMRFAKTAVSGFVIFYFAALDLWLVDGKLIGIDEELHRLIFNCMFIGFFAYVFILSIMGIFASKQGSKDAEIKTKMIAIASYLVEKKTNRFKNAFKENLRLIKKMCLES